MDRRDEDTHRKAATCPSTRDPHDRRLDLSGSNTSSVDGPDWLTESTVAPKWKGLDYIAEPAGQQDYIAHTPVAGTLTPCEVFQDQRDRLNSSHPRDLAVSDCSPTKMDGGGHIDTGVDFGCDFALRIPWDAQEELTDINSNNAVMLGSLPDVVGLCNRQPGAAASRIIQGRDSRSIRFLVPDPRGAIQNFHDVTVVDMDKMPEPNISTQELSLLRDQWPQAIFRYMTLRQQDLEILRNVTKLEFRQTRASECSYCGKVVREFMYRHVADFHLGLAQLWRCPISWCTIWAGSQSECMDHIRMGHTNWRPATSRVEEFIPPWTVSREFWTESLKAEHSGISMDIVLFGKIGLSLVHHYRIHRDGLPHIAFRRDYVTQLRTLLKQRSVATLIDAQPQEQTISIDLGTRNAKPVPAVVVPVVSKELAMEDRGIGETAGGISALHRTPVVGTWRRTRIQPVQGAPSVSVPLGEATLPQIETVAVVTILPVGTILIPP